MMLIEREIQDKLMTAIGTLQIDGSQMIGTWQTADDGEIAGREYADNNVLISVVVNPRSYDTAQIPTCNVTCGIGLIIPYDRDPTMSLTVDVAEKIMDLMQTYQDDIYQAREDLTTEHFDLAGFRLDGGYGIIKDNQNQIYTLQINFTLRGVVTK